MDSTAALICVSALIVPYVVMEDTAALHTPLQQVLAEAQANSNTETIVLMLQLVPTLEC